MLKLKRKITNPMTVIAIFAVISETSAAVSLPFLANKEREIYVWFLISFPVYLLFLFFVTLNFNYRSLYAPSDFGKDKNFLKAGKGSLDKRHPGNKSHHEDKASQGGAIYRRTQPQAPGHGGDMRRPHSVPDPPEPDALPHAILQHLIHLPASKSDLCFIDARQTTLKSDLAAILANTGSPHKRATRVIVLLSCHTSNELLKRHVARQLKQPRKGTITTLCIIYKVCSQELTIL
jgi:hypothetical protein